MAASVWIVILAGIAFVFWRLWKLAIAIEEQEAEEEAWRRHIEYVSQFDSYQAHYWQQLFDQRFK